MRIEVAAHELATGEFLRIVKHRFEPEGTSKAEADDLPRACVVTGIHGDELEGQFAVFELAKALREGREHLNGIVDIYPAANPMGIGAIERGIPQFDLDMNRIFPGNNSASPFETMAAELVADISGAAVAFDLHASNIFLREIPQIRINELWKDELVPLARLANVDLVWIHGNATVLKGTFAYSMNDLGVPTLVVEAGVGMRITQDVGRQLAQGMLGVLRELGIWSGPVAELREPTVSSDRSVSYLNAGTAGIFVPLQSLGQVIREGEVVGNIVDCGAGEVIEELRAPADGLLFTLREYPVVYPGNLIARVLGGE
jgi:hypothetical protein